MDSSLAEGRPAGAAPVDVDALARSLTDGNRDAAAAAFADALAARGGDHVAAADDVLVPAMYRVGELWHENRITVAREHLATATAHAILARAAERAPVAAPTGLRAVVACVEGNLHALGARLVADALESDGWDVEYLGADVPTRHLLDHLAERRPDALFVSIALPPQLHAARDLVRRARSTGALDGMRIVVGGRSVNEHADARRLVGADEWYPSASATRSRSVTA